MEKINKFFECLLPTSICNLECEYCYIIQENRREMKSISFDYSVEHILNCLKKDRIGGTSYFSLCGTGETFLQKELIPLVHGLLKEGHYVNITTNGTVTPKIIELLNFDSSLLKHLLVSFSFHYLELKKKNKIDEFFNNVKRVKAAGCSILVQLNLYDGYIPYLDEIKKICLENVGAYPQIAATRKEENGDVINNVKLHTSLSVDEYIKIGESFNSPLFDFTMKNFNKKRNEFCYAGEWSFNLNLKNGVLKSCYHSGKIQNIFENANKPIKYEAVGCNCKSLYCINSSHFISLGVIPNYQCLSYAELRDRPEANWFNDDMKSILSQKLYENNKELTIFQKNRINLKSKTKNIIKGIIK